MLHLCCTDPRTTQIYTLSLHDALPISASLSAAVPFINGYSWDLAIDGYTAPGGEKFVDTATNQVAPGYFRTMQIPLDRKSTRLNSSHLGISYAVFCLKKKNLKTPPMNY